MSWNTAKTRIWTLETMNNGTYWEDEFNRVYDNFIELESGGSVNIDVNTVTADTVTATNGVTADTVTATNGVTADTVTATGGVDTGAGSIKTKIINTVTSDTTGIQAVPHSIIGLATSNRDLSITVKADSPAGLLGIPHFDVVTGNPLIYRDDTNITIRWDRLNSVGISFGNGYILRIFIQYI